MEIALLTLDFPPSVGGVQQYLYELCRRIGRHCCLTTVVPRGNPALFKGEPFRVLPVHSSQPWYFARVLAMLRPHLTLVGHAHSRLLLPAAVLSRGRYMALTHGNDFEAAQLRWHAPIFNRLLSGAHPLVTNSRANARRLRDLGLPEPEIILPGTDPDRFTPMHAPHTGPPIILTVARLVSRKGIDTVLKALPPLLQLAPRLQYWIVGEGPEQSSLVQLVQDLQLSDAVRFLNSVSAADLPELYRRASIYVMPSREEYHTGSVEGFGIVYLEASASGLPVVAARSGGAAEAVIEDETGLLVPPDDPPALAKALARLLNDSALRQRLGSNGRSWVENEMNWDRVGRQFMSIIDRAL